MDKVQIDELRYASNFKYFILELQSRDPFSINDLVPSYILRGQSYLCITVSLSRIRIQFIQFTDKSKIIEKNVGQCLTSN
jgi:hypothetical protein